MQRRSSARELWDSAPWYEKLGMLVFLGGTSYAFLHAVVWLIFR